MTAITEDREYNERIVSGSNVTINQFNSKVHIATTNYKYGGAVK